MSARPKTTAPAPVAGPDAVAVAYLRAFDALVNINRIALAVQALEREHGRDSIRDELEWVRSHVGAALGKLYQVAGGDDLEGAPHRAQLLSALHAALWPADRVH